MLWELGFREVAPAEVANQMAKKMEQGMELRLLHIHIHIDVWVSSISGALAVSFCHDG